jgi:hypothetical protein
VQAAASRAGRHGASLRFSIADHRVGDTLIEAKVSTLDLQNVREFSARLDVVGSISPPSVRASLGDVRALHH